MIHLALFGQPVRYSLSPRIHQLFAGQAGLQIDYQAIDTGPGMLGEALECFQESGGSACNITVPLKNEARALAAHCSEQVMLAGAANTLTLADGQWRADSTDGPGLLMDLARQDVAVAGQRIALLGAGGAAASVLASLLAAGPASVKLFNRTGTRALEMARRHQHLGNTTGQDMRSLSAAGPFDLVINATSMGHCGEMPPVHEAMLARGGFFYDMNYGAAATGLEQWSRKHGIPHSSGLGMLVGQAAESFNLWTGYRPDIAPVLDTLARSGV